MIVVTPILEITLINIFGCGLRRRPCIFSKTIGVIIIIEMISSAKEMCYWLFCGLRLL